MGDLEYVKEEGRDIRKEVEEDIIGKIVRMKIEDEREYVGMWVCG